MSITRHHNDWLSLVPTSGPFLSLPVLTQTFPQGLEAHDPAHAHRLRSAFEEWDLDQSAKNPNPALHRAWIAFVLKETLGYEPYLAEGQEIPQTLRSDLPEYGETLRPDWVVNDPSTGKPRLLIQFQPRTQSLAKPVQSSRWKTSPETRMMQLLHDSGIRLGLVTNGDQWMLVNAPKSESTGFASWYANLWLEEQVTLRAFRTLLSEHRLFGVPDDETLEGLLDRSASDQQEVTDQLGYQVRKAVEVLVQALDKADQDHSRSLLADVEEKVLYEAALTVMMRLVFLFCAEERDLLLLGDELYDRNYAVSTLREQLRAAADQHGEEILGLRHDAWSRLLTTFRALHGGVSHDRIRIPAYGGSLFNPDRFPFLEGRAPGTSWKSAPATPLPISNRTVLHLLEALQILQVRIPGGGAPEARKLSFRELDIEQIGHVYEGLLDHTAVRASEPTLGLQGTRNKEPEITLARLESVAAKGEKELLKFLKEETGRSESALKKGLEAKIDDQLLSRFRTASQDAALWKRVEPFAGLVRVDTNGYPIVITTGSVFVTAGTDRRSSGTHYTPRSLTEPIVQHTLEPLVYIGPAEGLPREEWKLRSAGEILALRCCDMACGSGAFLVQTCRYLATRLLEAWDEVQRANPDVISITPEGKPSTGAPEEMLIPIDPDERQTFALRIVAQQCVYGVDKNPLAVEMAKLSLWLLTLAKDKPFEFLDHSIRCGDSLVGIHSLDQLRTFSLDGKGEANPLFLYFLDEKIKEVIALRQRIATMQSNSARDVEEQERMLREANESVARLKGAADLLVAVEFVPGSAADRKAARAEADQMVARYFDGDEAGILGEKAATWLDGLLPLHWILEFPEVVVEKGGFDAFVGNPPFMGGQKITGVFGTAYRDYIVKAIAGSRKGSADVCVFFVLQASLLTGSRGAIGLVVTSAIAEGDNREVGLEHLVGLGSVVFRADTSKPWPGSATVTYSAMWIIHGEWNSKPILNGNPEASITPYLLPANEIVNRPNRLTSNIGKSFVGHYVLGMGFLMSPAEAEELIIRNQQNKDVLFPFLNGEELNATWDSAPRRWVINFRQWPLSRASAGPDYSGPVAEDYPDCLQIVYERVKPERDLNNRPRRRERWWSFGDYAPGLERAMQLDKLLFAISWAAAPNIAFSRVKRGVLLSHTLVILALDRWSEFAAVSCSLHDVWTRAYTSYNLAIPRYTHSDCLLTFPFPALSLLLDELGQKYEAHRHELMRDRSIGLTSTYKLFDSPSDISLDFKQLRSLHIEMDNAVAAAYGWTDLDLAHGFHETKQGIRFTISDAARREVLARLLKLNHERYEEEVRQGLHDKKKGKAARGKSKANDTAASLFD